MVRTCSKGHLVGLLTSMFLEVLVCRAGCPLVEVLLEHSASLTALCDPPDLEEEEGTAKGGRRAGVRPSVGTGKLAC